MQAVTSSVVFAAPLCSSRYATTPPATDSTTLAIALMWLGALTFVTQATSSGMTEPATKLRRATFKWKVLMFPLSAQRPLRTSRKQQALKNLQVGAESGETLPQAFAKALVEGFFEILGKN